MRYIKTDSAGKTEEFEGSREEIIALIKGLKDIRFNVGQITVDLKADW